MTRQGFVLSRDEGGGSYTHPHPHPPTHTHPPTHPPTCIQEQLRTVTKTLVDGQRCRFRRHQHKVNLYSFLALALRTEAVDE